MNKIIFLLFFSLFVSYNAVSQKQKRLYEDKTIKCSYETTDGRFNGNYISYYKNGQKKSEGKFENNYRTGKWTVWDSKGKVIMQRVYENPFVFKQLIPEVPKDKPITLLNIPQYNLEYNKDGFINNFDFDERMVVWHKQIWRNLVPKDNPVLFENNKLFKLLNENILNKNITAYKHSKPDEFLEEIELSDFDTSSLKVLYYNIREDYIFDNERLVLESRIIGICPVVINKKMKDTVALNLYLIYFPDVRKYLAKELIQQNNLPAKVKTLDDLFFFRCFYGQISKESNVWDRPISKYKSGKEIQKEAEKIEIGIIETEHNLWKRLTN